MPIMLFSIFGESCTEKDLYQHVECVQHELLFAGDTLYEYPFLDLETTLAMTFSFNPYAVFA